MRAWVAARDIFNFPTMWEQIEALPTHVKLDTQLELFLEARRMVERGALWLLRHRRPPLEIAAVVAEFRPGIAELVDDARLAPRAARSATSCSPTKPARLAAGVPERVAQRSGAVAVDAHGVRHHRPRQSAAPRRCARRPRRTGRCSTCSTSVGCGMRSGACRATTGGRRRPARRCATT